MQPQDWVGGQEQCNWCEGREARRLMSDDDDGWSGEIAGRQVR